MNRTLRDELLRMAAEADQLHTNLTATGAIYDGYAPALEALNVQQARRLEAIIAQLGWPGRSLVGRKAAHEAWRIAVHAISLPHFQRATLPLLRDAIASGEAEPAAAAILEDKIHFMEGRPQRYGTQFDWDEHGVMSPWTLDDPERVDELRCGVGLGPLAEKVEQFRRDESVEHRPDYREHQRKFTEWARSVGWR